MDYKRPLLVQYLKDQFRLEWDGIHGANHWARVLYHSRQIGEARQADLLVVELFGFLHDSCRENDGRDPKHGARAAELAKELNTQFFELKPKQLDTLCYAITHHSGGDVSLDATIQTCWDGDRLDLGRVGITPSPQYLSKEAHPHIETALAMSIRGH